MTGIFVRAARVEDAAIVADFVHALIDELSGGKAPAKQGVFDIAQALLAGADVRAAIAYAGDAPVGVITLNQCAAIYAGGKFGEISELYVRADMRSQGVAQLLLDHAQQEARARGWARLEVGAPSQPEWHRTLNFYLRNGFDEVGPRLRRLA